MPASTLEIIPLLRAYAAPSPGSLVSLPGFAARMLGVPLSMLSLVEGRSFCSPGADDDAWAERRAAGLDDSLCRIPAATARPLLIEDARNHPVLRAEPGIWRGETSYAGVPVIGADGRGVGAFCAVGGRPRLRGA